MTACPLSGLQWEQIVHVDVEMDSGSMGLWIENSAGEAMPMVGVWFLVPEDGSYLLRLDGEDATFRLTLTQKARP
ncbi:MAG: hypothetical protein IJ438_09295 [Clostridia bacterium]|nr:hypothetical protein [Clostridia bacterium]